MTNAAAINPFFAARLKRVASPRPETSPRPQRRPEPEQPVYAKLPRAPKNTSPVPHLTSLYHFSRAGEYGDRRYPGNCGGNLIRDLLLYFKPEGLVLDPLCCVSHNWDYVPKKVMWRGTSYATNNMVYRFS